ncbi:MAG: DUF2161 family putative PD-(D/E)XK-type phosphodiesterase [Paracoccaceae bacterium]
MSKPKETDLYPPVKAFLQGQGYEVKAEIGAVDVMAIRGDDDPVIVELKTGFSLSLFHQAVDRQGVTDDVYICVPRGTGKVFAKALKDNTRLCRRLGVGLLTARLRDGFVQAHCDPAPYRPVKSARRKGQLLREFQRRVGDPNAGGQTRVGLVTAYRQDAMLCAGFLAENGASKGAVVAAATGVPTATRIMAADHYGWFERAGRGVYQLTAKGLKG